MASQAKNYLTDKDIRSLEVLDKKYRKAVGAPKELFIVVNPSGIKKFTIKKENGAFDSFGILQEFRPGIYSVAEARRDANKVLKDLSENKDIEVIKGKADKFNYGSYFERFMEYKQKFDRCSDDYLKKMRRAHELYILPSLAKRDIRSIKYSDVIDILNPITQRHKEVENQKNRKYSYLETIRRLVSVVEGVFDIARKDGYISSNFITDIRKDFCKSKAYKHIKGADTRLPAITDEKTLKSF